MSGFYLKFRLPILLRQKSQIPARVHSDSVIASDWRCERQEFQVSSFAVLSIQEQTHT